MLSHLCSSFHSGDQHQAEGQHILCFSPMNLVAAIISTCSICASVSDQVHNTEPEGDFYHACTNWQQSTTAGQRYCSIKRRNGRFLPAIECSWKTCNSFSCPRICVKVHATGEHWRISQAINYYLFVEAYFELTHDLTSARML